MLLQNLMLPLLAGLSSNIVSAQNTATNCLNNLAYYNPTLRSTCYNGTFFIVPVPKATLQQIVPYPLLNPPFSDKSLFPKGFPAGSHPVILNIGLQNDIRMFNLKITRLFGAAIQVPYTDRLRNGKTPFLYSIQNYIGGYNGDDLAATVPTTVGTLEGTTIFIGRFYPGTDPYGPLSSNPNEFVSQVTDVIIPNPVSGPEVLPAVIDYDFLTATSPLYTPHTFHALINQASTQNNGLLCQRNTYYFNQTFTNGVLRTGNVTLYGPAHDGAAPAQVDNRYVKAGGYSASSNMLGYNPEDCAVAAANVDPVATA